MGGIIGPKIFFEGNNNNFTTEQKNPGEKKINDAGERSGELPEKCLEMDEREDKAF